MVVVMHLPAFMMSSLFKREEVGIDAESMLVLEEITLYTNLGVLDVTLLSLSEIWWNIIFQIIFA